MVPFGGEGGGGLFVCCSLFNVQPTPLEPYQDNRKNRGKGERWGKTRASCQTVLVYNRSDYSSLCQKAHILHVLRSSGRMLVSSV